MEREGVRFNTEPDKLDERGRRDGWVDDAFFNLPFDVEKGFIEWNIGEEADDIKAEHLGGGNRTDLINEVLRVLKVGWGKHREVRRENRG